MEPIWPPFMENPMGEIHPSLPLLVHFMAITTTTHPRPAHILSSAKGVATITRHVIILISGLFLAEIEGLAYPSRAAWGVLPHLMVPTFPQNNTHINQLVMKSDCHGWRMMWISSLTIEALIRMILRLKMGCRGGGSGNRERRIKHNNQPHHPNLRSD